MLQVEDLLDEIEELRRRLSSHNRHARSLLPPATYCFIPSPSPSPVKMTPAPQGAFFYTPSASYKQPGGRRHNNASQQQQHSSRRRLNFNETDGKLKKF